MMGFALLAVVKCWWAYALMGRLRAVSAFEPMDSAKRVNKKDCN